MILDSFALSSAAMGFRTICDQYEMIPESVRRFVLVFSMLFNTYRVMNERGRLLMFAIILQQSALYIESAALKSEILIFVASSSFLFVLIKGLLLIYRKSAQFAV